MDTDALPAPDDGVNTLTTLTSTSHAPINANRSNLVTYIIAAALFIALLGYIGCELYVAQYNPQEGVWAILSAGQKDLKEIILILGSGLLGALKSTYDNRP